MSTQKYDYDLTCWYLNKRRILELLGTEPLLAQMQTYSLRDSGYHRNLFELALFKEALANWLNEQKPPTLGQILISGEVRKGSVFTLFTNYFFKGSMKTFDAVQKNKLPAPPILAHAKLDDIDPGRVLECRFHHEHLTSNSSWSELSGHGVIAAGEPGGTSG